MAPRKARNFNGYIPKFEVSSVELHATLGDGWPCWGEVGSWGVTFLPCSACCRPERDKTRPARAKHTKFGAFVSAGRILSRTRPDMPRVGRRKSRLRVPLLDSQTMRRPPRQPRSGASECLPSVVSHVIPLRLLQTMKLQRCNCNFCGWSPKVTAGNYVRLLSGSGSGPAAARAHRKSLS